MADNNMLSLDVVRKELMESQVDLPREMLKAMVEKLMGSEVDALCNAGYGDRTEDRTNSRNGYRNRAWDTRVGTVPLAIPKLRQGSYFPEWLLEPRRRAERALAEVVVEAYVLGVSTRRVENLVETMGLKSMSKSQVSRLAEELDVLVGEFRSRPLDGSPYTYVWVDALSQKCREGGRIVNVATVVATGVNAEGHREILGLDIFTNEDTAAWTAFLRGLVDRGLGGVQLVVSDAHLGLKEAIATVFAGASWQRCRTHFMRNVMSHVPKSAQDMVATLVRTVFSQLDRASVEQRYDEVVVQLESQFQDVADLMAEAKYDVLAFAAFPKQQWKQIWSNNPQERLNKEIRRRTDVVGIFPNRPAIIRLIGAVLSEQNDEWSIARRYMNPNILREARVRVIENETLTKEVDETQQLIAG
ncbi:MAG: IS256 family transposase [bacterium]|nr:IS256 family transposase [bacterium]